jgi:catechol 2,3-dioxygenase-like lactoylglutathione lyase family enzyme
MIAPMGRSGTPTELSCRVNRRAPWFGMSERSPVSTSSPSGPRLERLLETALYVEEMDRARAFYVDVLGSVVMLDTPRLLALAVGSDSVLLLFRRGSTVDGLDTPGGWVPAHGANGVQHIAFAMESGDTERWIERLSSAGVAIESRVKWPRGGESVYVRDPDGHSIELVTRGLWPIY